MVLGAVIEEAGLLNQSDGRSGLASSESADLEFTVSDGGKPLG